MPPLHARATHGKLGRATANVENQIRAVGGVELGGRTKERELGFFVARDELGAHADSALGYVEEHVTVRSVPGG